MGSRGFAIVAACVALATAGLAQGATPAAQAAPKLLGLDHGTTTLDAAQQLQLSALPPKERRQRIDAVLAAHPDDVVAHMLRAQADSDLRDFAATLIDLEPVIPALANGAKPRSTRFAARR